MGSLEVSRALAPSASSAGSETLRLVVKVTPYPRSYDGQVAATVFAANATLPVMHDNRRGSVDKSAAELTSVRRRTPLFETVPKAYLDTRRHSHCFTLLLPENSLQCWTRYSFPLGVGSSGLNVVLQRGVLFTQAPVPSDPN